MKNLALLLLLAITIATPVWAADEPPAAVVTPDPRTLGPDWWNYIAEAGSQLSERAAALTGFAETAVRLKEEQSGQPDDDSNQYLNRLRLNLEALPGLQQQSGATPAAIPASAPEYSVEEYLQIERELRQSRLDAQTLSETIKRNEDSAVNAQRRIDTLLANYLALPDVDPSRLRHGLQIMAARSGLAIAQEQLRVRQETLVALTNRIEQLELLVDQAEDVVVATPAELSAVEARLNTLRTERLGIETELNDREARTLGAQGETPEELARSAWRELRVIEMAAKERELALELARRGLEQSWFSMALAPDEAQAHLAIAQERLNDATELLSRTRSELDDWEEQAERDLVALRSVSPELPSRELQRIDQQRLTAANDALRNIAQARSIASDTELVIDLVQARVSAEQGLVVGGVSSLGTWLERAWDKGRNWLGASLFKMGDTPVTTFGLMRVGLILFIAIWISRLFRHALDRVGSKGEGTQSAFYTVGRLAHYVIIAAAIVIGLSSIGLSFANLAIVAGALGVGIGFGLQSIVNNFVSGLILLFERSLKVGDYVQLESGVGGIVKEINVRSTLINTNQNLDILVPNSEFVSGRLTNWTLKDASRRLHIPFGVAYGSDKDLVKKVVLEAAETIPHTVKDNALRRPDVWLVNFGDSSLDFELTVWIKQASVRNPARVQANYLWAIETALVTNGLEIPFPQRDLHLRSGFFAELPVAQKSDPIDS